MFSRTLAVYSLAASLTLLTACGKADARPDAAVKSLNDRFPIKVGERVVQMQIAAQPGEMENGLMHRLTLGADEGMLFLYTRPTQMHFWMRNTEIPLNIGYFDASGVLRETYEMYPHDERAVSSHAHDLQFALEMNQGWYKQAGVKPGAQLDLKAVADALTARGFKPSAWGLR